MAFDQRLAARVRRQLANRPELQEKGMFGGLGFLRSGHMAVGIWKDHLIARVGKEHDAEARALPGAKAFDITGRPMQGWVMVTPEGISTDVLLHDWIDRAWTFAGTLPPKT